MSSGGWILLHRQLLEHPLWMARPFSKGQAWVDLLLLASWREHRTAHGQPAERGELHTSQEHLAARWGWGRKAVSRFLKCLENVQMLSLKTSSNRHNGGTIIRILNYEVYQNPGTANGTANDPAKARRGHSEGTHHKEVKEGKEFKQPAVKADFEKLNQQKNGKGKGGRKGALTEDQETFLQSLASLKFFEVQRFENWIRESKPEYPAMLNALGLASEAYERHQKKPDDADHVKEPTSFVFGCISKGIQCHGDYYDIAKRKFRRTQDERSGWRASA